MKFSMTTAAAVGAAILGVVGAVGGSGAARSDPANAADPFCAAGQALVDAGRNFGDVDLDDPDSVETVIDEYHAAALAAAAVAPAEIDGLGDVAKFVARFREILAEYDFVTDAAIDDPDLSALTEESDQTLAVEADVRDYLEANCGGVTGEDDGVEPVDTLDIDGPPPADTVTVDTMSDPLPPGTSSDPAPPETTVDPVETGGPSATDVDTTETASGTPVSEEFCAAGLAINEATPPIDELDEGSDPADVEVAFEALLAALRDAYDAAPPELVDGLDRILSHGVVFVAIVEANHYDLDAARSDLRYEASEQYYDDNGIAADEDAVEEFIEANCAQGEPSDTVDSTDTVDSSDSVDTVDTVDSSDSVDTVDTVDSSDSTDTVDSSDSVDTVDTGD